MHALEKTWNPSDSRIDTLGPLWHPWYPGWSGWAYWDPEPQETFVTHYSGHVVANLAGPDENACAVNFSCCEQPLSSVPD
jgi:hypothetical protein